MKKTNWKDWLYFSKKEQRAAITLIAVIGIIFLLPRFFKKKQLSLPDNAVSGKTTLDTSKTTNGNEPQVALFPFDPNTLSTEDWIQFGISAKTAQTIQHYISKGGQFRKAEDLYKIYGLPREQAARLIPYVQLRNNYTATAPQGFDAGKTLHYIHINSASAAEWATLPGIGNVLSERIVHFRNSKKGFNSVDELSKVYGLPAETFARIKPYLKYDINTSEKAVTNSEKTVPTITEKSAPTEIKNIVKVNINKASTEEILTQKAIPKQVAKAIVIYREQHGLYTQISDVKKIIFINDDLYQRIAPYLKTED